MSRARSSLRSRLMWGLSLTTCLLWGSVAAWQFTSMQRELRAMLDDRLIASAKMVADIVQQIHPDPQAPITPAASNALHSLIARDGVACEVSLVRSEVEVLPIARTGDSPDLSDHQASGFGQTVKGGKLWRTYVLQDNGIRVATADREDVREHLVQSILRTLVWPFVLTLAGILWLTWWICTYSLRPLELLRKELSERPPQDPTPVTSGEDIAELSPLVHSLNALLSRINASMERERRWTANAAHELRTPLTAIKTHVQVAQLALGNGLQATRPEIAEDALRQADTGILQLQATLEQLLQLARVENANSDERLHSDGQAIAGAFHQACEQSQRRARAERPGAPALLHTGMEPNAEDAQWPPVRLSVAPALLVCAITNLLDNALLHQAAEHPVRATLELLRDGERAAVQVRVSDQGPGLSAAEMELATQRFWRKHAGSSGSGLGLTIVRHIAESAGGELVLESTGEGLTATLHMPVSVASSHPS